MNLRLVAAAICAAALHVSPALASSPLDLTFDGAPSPGLWTSWTLGTGPSAAVRAGALEITFPADSANDPAAAAFAAGLASRCVLRGDFEVVLDYQLLDWPVGNGVRSGIVLNGIMGANRTSLVDGEAAYHSQVLGLLPPGVNELYEAGIGGGMHLMAPTADVAGKLRVRRTGSVITGSYAGAAGWQDVATWEYPAATDVGISLQAWSHDYAFSDRPVKLAFTNFQVVSGQMSCNVK